MIESVCTVLNNEQEPLNTMNMEIYVHVWEVSPLCIYRHDWDNILVNKFTELDVYLDINNISHLGKYMVSKMALLCISSK